MRGGVFGLLQGWVFGALVSASANAAPTPMRVVTLMPSLAELAAEVLGEHVERIVGVSEYTDYPPALKSRTSIGPYPRVNLEKIVGLRPDLILASKDGNSAIQVERLARMGLNVVTVETNTFDQIQASMRTVGAALGDPKIGEAMALRLQKGLDQLQKQRVGQSRRPRVLIQLGSDPLITIGKQAFLHQALEAVGAQNIFEDQESAYPKPTMEWVIKKNPELILVIALGDQSQVFEAMARAWSKWSDLAAVKNHQIVILKADALLRPSSRLLEGLALLKKAVDRVR